MSDRLKRAISGEWVTGERTGLGGGFRFVALQNKVDAKALLAMERDEMADAVIASHLDVNHRGSSGLILMNNQGYEYLVARNSLDEGFFLVWMGPSTPRSSMKTYMTLLYARQSERA